MSSAAMRRMELLLLKSDIDSALRYLSSKNCFQIIFPDVSPLPEAKEKQTSAAALAEASEEAYLARLDGALAKLGQLGTCLGLRQEDMDLGAARLPDEALLDEIDKFTSSCAENEQVRLVQKRKLDDLEESLRELRAFAGLSLPFEDISKLSFVSMRLGKVDPEKIPALDRSLDDRAAIIPMDNAGSIVAVASRKGRFALETELAKAGFVKMNMPPDFRGVPADALSALQTSYEEAKENVAALEARRKTEADRISPAWIVMLSSVKLGRALKRVEKKLEGTELVFRLAGWVPSENVETLIKDFQSMFGDRIAIRLYDPEDEEGNPAQKGREVPVLLKQSGFVSAFQGIVLSYGTPVYGDIDPTPFVAFFFTFLFAIMFGDIGQGAVILALGLLISKAEKGLLRNYKKYWPAFVAAGAGSMFMGLLVGSFFSDEKLLIPIERFLTGLILGTPRDRFLDIMPSSSLGSMFYFFGFTVGIGFLINSTGLVINMINLARKRKWGEALFSKTGLSGALLFWWASGMGVRVILGGKLGWIDFIGLGLPLLALFFTKPLENAMAAAERNHGGGGASEARTGEDEKISVMDVLVGGLVEIIETLSYYASNTMSFLRVAAFALAHAVLSFVVFTMAELVRTRAPGGFFFQFIIFVVGNLIIISLEGLIVTIQVIRLQYYEFFSKFFTQTGRAFDPIRFEP